MNGFNVYKNISKPKKKLNHEAEDLYLMLLGNPTKIFDDVLSLKLLINTTKKFTHRQKCCFI